MTRSFNKYLYKMKGPALPTLGFTPRLTSKIIGAVIGAALSYAIPAQAQISHEIEPTEDHQAVLPQAIGQNIDLYDAALAPLNLLETERPIAASSDQEFCITVMSGFPNNGAGPRYQFYKLVQDLALDATPDFQRVLSAYGDDAIDANTPIMTVIEDIANPVLRQAVPELTIGNMAHLIDFNIKCSANITGQIDSLLAYDNSIKESDHVIAEDALFLRQILLESLMRQGAESDPNFSQAMQAYETALLTTRNNIEFKSFDEDLSNLEALYMDDLDGRLARSNDIINSEIDRSVLSSAVELSEDIHEAADEARKRGLLETLVYILN